MSSIQCYEPIAHGLTSAVSLHLRRPRRLRHHTPVEAMAAGTPVIAYKGGGALDYVVPGKTGEFF